MLMTKMVAGDDVDEESPIYYLGIGSTCNDRHFLNLGIA